MSETTSAPPTSPLAASLRSELAGVANCPSHIPLGQWQRFSAHVLEAADLLDTIAGLPQSPLDLAYTAANVLHARGSLPKAVRREAVVGLRTFRDVIRVTRGTDDE